MYSDYAHFEAFMLLDTLRSRSNILSHEQRILLVKELFSRRDFGVDLQKAMSDLPNRSSAYVSMLKHNRAELKALVDVLFAQHSLVDDDREIIFGHYAAILLFYFTLRWYWMSNKREFNEDDLVFQLVACSELISVMIGKP
jgi:hypothetical protein